MFVVGLEGVYSINATTGTLNWWANTIDMLGGTAVAQGVLYAAEGDVTTLAVSTVTGNSRWAGNFGSNSFAVGGGTLYTGNNYGVEATNTSTSYTVWNFSTSQQVLTSPAVVNGVVYAVDNSGIVYAINASYGYELWSFQTGGVIYTSPVVANGMLYVTTQDGTLYAFSLPSGPAKMARPNPAGLTPDMTLNVSGSAL